MRRAGEEWPKSRSFLRIPDAAGGPRVWPRSQVEWHDFRKDFGIHNVRLSRDTFGGLFELSRDDDCGQPGRRQKLIDHAKHRGQCVIHFELPRRDAALFGESVPDPPGKDSHLVKEDLFLNGESCRAHLLFKFTRLKAPKMPDLPVKFARQFGVEGYQKN